jgi:Anthranilate phosphoribosyltransferase
VAILEGGAVSTVSASMEASIDSDIRGGSAEENAAELRALLDGGGRPGHRNAVLINAAAALVVAGRAKNVPEGVPIAAQSLDSGAAREALAKLIAISEAAP